MNTTILLCEELGCAYSIDSEGTMYYSPLENNSWTLETDDWSEVDFMSLLGEEQYIQDTVSKCHEKLITMMKSVGEYYQK